MKAAVNCDECGRRQILEREITEPESFLMTCHECENIIRVEVTEADILDYLVVLITDGQNLRKSMAL